MVAVPLICDLPTLDDSSICSYRCHNLRCMTVGYFLSTVLEKEKVVGLLIFPLPLL